MNYGMWTSVDVNSRIFCEGSQRRKHSDIQLNTLYPALIFTTTHNLSLLLNPGLQSTRPHHTLNFNMLYSIWEIILGVRVMAVCNGSVYSTRLARNTLSE